jgi:hypothetical protein
MRVSSMVSVVVTSLMVGTLLSGGLGARPAVAAEPACLRAQIDDDNSFTDRLTRGESYTVFILISGVDGNGLCRDDEVSIPDLENVASFQLDLRQDIDGTLESVSWRNIDRDLPIGAGALTYSFLDDFDVVTDTIVWDVGDNVGSEGFQLFTDDFIEVGEPGSGLKRYTLLFLDVSDDAVRGDYVLRAAVNDSAPGLIAASPYQFTVVSAPSNPPPPRPTELSCDVVPTVGATVTCTVRADANIDILWSASTNPVFAEGVVTTDAAGIGTFSFVVPAGALGQQVLVEVVGWLAPQAIGTAGGPVPRSIPAGDAPDSRAALLLLLAGLAVVAPRALREARFTADR